MQVLQVRLFSTTGCLSADGVAKYRHCVLPKQQTLAPGVVCSRSSAQAFVQEVNPSGTCCLEDQARHFRPAENLSNCDSDLGSSSSSTASTTTRGQFSNRHTRPHTKHCKQWPSKRPGRHYSSSAPTPAARFLGWHAFDPRGAT